MVRRFLHFCSGADGPLLDHPDCRTEHAKYAGVGAAVFFTALFAVVSASYALYYVFGTPWVIGLGLVWGLFIFSLDRYIVATMRKGLGWLAEWRLALPRLLMAFFLAIIISKPLELKIFEREINNELLSMEQEAELKLTTKVKRKTEALRPRLVTEIERLKAELATSATALREQQIKVSDELNGTRHQGPGGGTSGHYGAGPAYQRELTVLQQLDSANRQLIARQQPLLDQRQRALQHLDSTTTREIAAVRGQRERNDGLLGRLTAIARLEAADPAVNRASLVLTLLFILIETAPVFVKLLSAAGPYDFKLNALEDQVKAREIETLSTLNQEVNRNLHIAVGESDQAVQAQLQANKELLAKINSAQLEIAQEMLDQWKTGELDKLRQGAPAPPDADAVT